MQFQPHPSVALTALFRQKPFQGQDPQKARILFLSSDANYSPAISEHEFFRFILEYQEDGVGFWRKYGVHHPFLLNAFPFDKTQHGRPFHQRFAKLGLDSTYAEHICFMEMLDVPTVGNKSDDLNLFYQLADRAHLESLDELITHESHRLVLVPAGVIRDMMRFKQMFGVFDWLPDRLAPGPYQLEVGTNKIQQMYHFSSSHIFRQLPEIRRWIDDWLGVQ